MQRLAALLVVLLLAWPAHARSGVIPAGIRAEGLHLPRLAAAPRIEDFVAMQAEEASQAGENQREGALRQAQGGPHAPTEPQPELHAATESQPGAAVPQMAHITEMRQFQPGDGVAASERTDVYLGYDSKNIYAVWVCFDRTPGLLRAHLTRRENIWDDDTVDLWLDTFDDQHHAYEFMVNPLGVQADGIETEGQGEDFSFDTLWYSRGRRTAQGYVVWMAIPFKSLRFTDADVQKWGILLERRIPRNNEVDFWPTLTKRISGLLPQESHATGLEGIAPARNMQFIPYGLARSFRSLDTRDPVLPAWSQAPLKMDGGLDSKIILRDSFVLDTTVEPDFSQVETDDPQVTVNQRFAVYFPEKRPFFLENASYFQTPINLFFTRNIANPQYGARLTGKSGPYSVGVLFADDRAPGLEVAPSDPLAGTRAYYGIGRISRDILGNGSNVGLMYTDREFQGSENRVGGVDGRIRLNQNWSTSFQAVESSTYDRPTNTYAAGPAIAFTLDETSRSFGYNFNYADYSDGFETLTGFYGQTDIHNLHNWLRYRWYPGNNRWLVSAGPNFSNYETVDHEGDQIGWGYMPEWQFNFQRNTNLAFGYAEESETLRPRDYSALGHNQAYPRSTKYVRASSHYFRQFSFGADYRYGRKLVYDAPDGVAPYLGRRTSLNFWTTLRPLDRLEVDNSYILSRYRDVPTGLAIFNNHIVQTKWNYQFTREWSARAIVQYDAVLADPRFTSLDTTKGVAANFLITYLVHPGTALYVGYNSSLDNINRQLGYDPSGNLLRTANGFLNDGREIFVKVSYLLRF